MIQTRANILGEHIHDIYAQYSVAWMSELSVIMVIDILQKNNMIKIVHANKSVMLSHIATVYYNNDWMSQWWFIKVKEIYPL